jgi:hypothetical protein
MNEIDLIININLQMIYENESKEEYYTHFTDEKKGILINHNYSGETIAFEMVNKGLIRLNGENCHLISFGEEVCLKGGWTRYLELQKIEVGKNKETEKERQNLKDGIDKLIHSELIHKEEIREQENRIRDLEEGFKKYETNQGKKIKNWSFIIVVINLIMVFASFFIQNRIEKPIENPKIDQLKKKQLRILKRLDSLKNPLKPKPILNQPKK